MPVTSQVNPEAALNGFRAAANRAKIFYAFVFHPR